MRATDDAAGAGRIALGRRGEELAARYLEGEGYAILDRNWRCALGELDLVCRDGPRIVVAEVKTRRSLAAGHPLESIVPSKRRRLGALAWEWMRAHPEERGAPRIDAVAVLLGPRAPEPVVVHVVGVEP